MSKAGNALATERRRKNKTALVQRMGGVCRDCDLEATEERFPQFHFHHVGEKEKGVANLLTGDWDALVKEADKCVLLCGPCHHLRHKRERQASSALDSPAGGWNAWFRAFPEFEGLSDLRANGALLGASQRGGRGAKAQR